jgi:hypothetical protein
MRLTNLVTDKNFILDDQIRLLLCAEDTSDHPQAGVSSISSDFQCFVCGAIFTTDEDRKGHLAKEAKGELLAFSDDEKQIAIKQEALNERRKHYF